MHEIHFLVFQKTVLIGQKRFGKPRHCNRLRINIESYRAYISIIYAIYASIICVSAIIQPI